MPTPLKTGRLVKDPVYRQLNGLLQGLIRDGEFKAGQQFLTEREVGERFGVSRVTANKALSHLVVEGVLEFRKGVGSFVREGVLDYDLQSLMSFTRKAALAGKQSATRVLKFESLKAGRAHDEVRQALRLGEGDPLYYFERLRLVEGEPVILERRHLAARLCPGLTRALVQGSLYDLLTRKYGLPVTAADETIQAVNLSSADARRLRVPAGTAALRVRAVGHAESPLWFEDTLYRGDRYEFHNAIGAAKRPRPASLVICGPPAPIKCGATQAC
ncbi:MAG: GntR family transcriptional regulator [Verrucomicrobiota bacterium]|jgi:GntR family transcriptional regulator